jgi:S-adenosylmethionine decarboxylase
MEIGAEWLVEAAGCRAGALASVARMWALFDRIVAELDLHPVREPLFHPFPPPGGITGFVILSESHLACHSYPEHGILTVNLYCCRPRAEWPWRERLAEMVGATHVEVRQLERGVTAAEVVPWR